MADKSNNLEKKIPPKPIFEIQRLYVKEQSCKIPHGSGIFQEEAPAPEIALEMNVKHEALGENRYEIILLIHTTTKIKERTGLLIDVQQVGIFRLDGFTEEQQLNLLNGYCPNVLYPYARKIIADASINASFPAIVLAPVNFEGLYAASQQEAKTNSSAIKKEVVSSASESVN